MKMHMPVLTVIEQAAQEALTETARAVLAEAQLRVPVDEGDLRDSGRVQVSDLEARVAFKSPIAWLQHERLDYQHPNGGQAKYLEAAIDAVGAGEMLASKVQAVLKRGRR